LSRERRLLKRDSEAAAGDNVQVFRARWDRCGVSRMMPVRFEWHGMWHFDLELRRHQGRDVIEAFATERIAAEVIA